MAAITCALARVRRTHGVDLLPDEPVVQLLRGVGVVWRERLLTPLTTLRLFVLQVLFGNTSITLAVMVAESEPARLVAPVPVKLLYGVFVFIRFAVFFQGPFGLFSRPKKLGI